jgi:hypothetical protein
MKLCQKQLQKKIHVNVYDTDSERRALRSCAPNFQPCALRIEGCTCRRTNPPIRYKCTLMGYQVIITMSELTFTQTKAIKEYCTNFPHRIHPAGETQYSFSGRSIFLLKHPLLVLALFLSPSPATVSTTWLTRLQIFLNIHPRLFDPH